MKIAIVGIGHMGSWMVKELSAKHELCLFDLDPSRLMNMNDAVCLNSLSELQDFNPELFINAVSIQNTVKVFQSASSYLSQNCIIADMASVKDKIPEYYKTCGFNFVSLHAMFGPTFANVESLKNENVILIRESNQEGADFFKIFFKELGLNIFEYTFVEHDEMIAYSLTLPFASTMVFAACMNISAVPGSTFKKHLYIARGLLSEDDYLLTEILFNHSSLKQLEKVTNKLEFLKHVIIGKDRDEAIRFFNNLRKNIK